MSPRAIPSVHSDFTSVIDYLSTCGVIKNGYTGNIKTTAKKIHSATYSLILWRFRLRNLPPRGKNFIDEIASDALQILPQSLLGYDKTVNLLTRGIIENIFRHIYFADHPVEFDRMNRDIKWFLTMDALVDYAKIHPIFAETERQFDAINRLTSLYGDMSAGIHGRTVRDLETRTALKKIQYNEVAGAKHSVAIQKCAASTNFLLAMFHRNKMQKFQVEDRSIILRTMPVKARGVWRDYEG